MNATATTSMSPGPTAAERFEEVAPVIAAGRGAGPSVFVLVGPLLLLVLLLVPPVAFLVVLLAAVALPFVAVGLVVAVVASPYLLARAVQRHLAERRTSSKRSAPLAVPALASSTAARRAR